MEVERRSFNPWPWGLAIALALMIGASLTVLGIAIAKPDARVEAHPLAADGTAPRPAD
ncbi:MAG: hypothetical protein ABFS41_04060 [Myxococcota bacterium]